MAEDTDDLLSALRFGVDSYAVSVADDGCVDDLEQMLSEGAFDKAAHLAHACGVRQEEFDRTDWVATGWRELDDPTLPEPVKAYIALIGMEKMIELQQYIKKPPGKGMGIVYVQISPVNKMYAGQHCHGAKGESFRISRMDKSKKPGCRHVYNAFQKYGIENFTHIILHHGPEGEREGDPVDGDCNEREIYFIDHWDLLRPEVGMNLRTGGGGGALSLEVRAKLREKMLQPGVREANSARAVAQWADADDETRAAWRKKMSVAHLRSSVREAARERAISQWADADDKTRAEWRAANSAAHLRPEVREANRRTAKAAEAARVAAGRPSLPELAAAWKVNNRKEFLRIMSKAHSRPEVREAARKRAISQWADATEETRAAWRQKMSAAQLRPEMREAARKRAKAAEAARVAAGELSLTEKLAAWRANNPEAHESWRTKLQKTHLRPEVREKHRASAVAQFEREEAEDPGGRSRRVVEWQANNPEKVAAARAKTHATMLQKRQQRLDDAPDDATRAKLQKQFDKVDRRTERKRQKTMCDAGSSADHAAGV